MPTNAISQRQTGAPRRRNPPVASDRSPSIPSRAVALYFCLVSYSILRLQNLSKSRHSVHHCSSSLPILTALTNHFNTLIQERSIQSHSTHNIPSNRHTNSLRISLAPK
ncbi:hypothetical protein EYC84_011440 [Monilinia fructicola]|uniref:Uncharacterized protein n=1 Tax=Monilinia fructicola TaxID=38448 RepID=A0A5M9JB35_MONFR|nr:hypothetical protein EYC84_011440 [Monilinia fructicola]